MLTHSIGSVSSGNVTISEALAMMPGSLPGQQAAALRFANRAVAIVRQPVEDWAPQFAALQAEAASLPALARMISPALIKIAGAFRSSHAEMRCAIAAVAAERFRLSTGHWPESLDALVAAKLLAAVPRDPFDNQPLRLKPTPYGLVIYSVGSGVVDDGGQVTRKSSGPASADLGVRLWNPDLRKQPPPQ